MKKLIEVHAFANCPVFSCGGDPNDPYYAGYCDALDRVVEWMESFPAVDAVPVVRCKDCKHYGWDQEPCHGRIQQFCKLHKGLVVVHRETFCSYGERRTDG